MRRSGEPIARRCRQGIITGDDRTYARPDVQRLERYRDGRAQAVALAPTRAAARTSEATPAACEKGRSKHATCGRWETRRSPRRCTRARPASCSGASSTIAARTPAGARRSGEGSRKARRGDDRVRRGRGVGELAANASAPVVIDGRRFAGRERRDSVPSKTSLSRVPGRANQARADGDRRVAGRRRASSCMTSGTVRPLVASGWGACRSRLC